MEFGIVYPTANSHCIPLYTGRTAVKSQISLAYSLILVAISVYLVADLPDAWLVEAVAPLGVEPCLEGGLFCGVFVGSAIVKRERSISMVRE